MSSESQLALRPQSQLAQLLVQRIREAGKITFHDWMAEALYHPTLGYYNRSDLKRWGRSGDYRTSPERSELFAATFARYFVSLYRELGQPAEFTIVEIGAGNGEFAAGVLATLKRSYSDIFNSTRYEIVETSRVSRRVAAERLHGFSDHVEFAESHDLRPREPGIVFTNELLDAFPIHRLTILNGRLAELFVSLNSEGSFIWTVDDPSSQELVDAYRSHVPQLTEGQVIELNLGISDWFRRIAQILKSGYLITVDYGHEAESLYSSTEHPHGTLRAFRSHQFVEDVLSDPGEYDITSSVDWTFVKSEGKQYGFELDQFIGLDRFLMQAGVLEELEFRLTDAKSAAETSALTTSAREMILPGGMASSFQVLVQRR